MFFFLFSCFLEAGQSGKIYYHCCMQNNRAKQNVAHFFFSHLIFDRVGEQRIYTENKKYNKMPKKISWYIMKIDTRVGGELLDSFFPRKYYTSTEVLEVSCFFCCTHDSTPPLSLAAPCNQTTRSLVAILLSVIIMATSWDTPWQIGDTEIRNRFVLSPMTRCRATLDLVPTDRDAEVSMLVYYEQRASAGETSAGRETICMRLGIHECGVGSQFEHSLAGRWVCLPNCDTHASLR